MLEKRVKRQLLEEVQSICPPHVTIMQVRRGWQKARAMPYCARIPLSETNLSLLFCQTLFLTNTGPTCLRIAHGWEMITPFSMETGNSQIYG